MTADAETEVTADGRPGSAPERVTGVEGAAHLGEDEQVGNHRDGDLEADSEDELVTERRLAELPVFEPVPPAEGDAGAGAEDVEVTDGAGLQGSRAFAGEGVFRSRGDGDRGHQRDARTLGPLAGDLEGLAVDPDPRDQPGVPHGLGRDGTEPVAKRGGVAGLVEHQRHVEGEREPTTDAELGHEVAGQPMADHVCAVGAERSLGVVGP